ncbi:MAG: polysaccharide deacetylase family protein [Acutalibacter sp.]|nr:polysaccharide deacetylase family protein [Acutalibacter sp.]
MLFILLLAGTACLPQPVQAAEKKLVAITYDDGPYENTERLLDGLKERGVHATFFLVGKKIPSLEKTVARMYEEGHQVANHSFSHENLTAIPLEEVKKQVQDTNALLDKICGPGTDYMVRPPYGHINEGAAQAVGLPCILWSFTPKDWVYTDADAIKQQIVDGVQEGDIILLHDKKMGTVEGSLAAIDELRAQGYEFVTVRELFRRQGRTAENAKWYTGGSLVKDFQDPGPVQSPQISYTVGQGSLEVSISGPAGVPLYYSADGSPLNQQSRLYTGPFTVTGPCTIRACAAYNMNGSRSGTVEEQITQATAFTPVLRLENGLLAMEGVQEGAQIHYTLTGAQDSGGEKLYTGPVAVKPGTVAAAYAAGEGFFPSGTAKLVYSPLGNVFCDVFPTDWYFDSVDKVAAEGIMLGTGEGCFSPADQVTRGQLATFLHRASREALAVSVGDSNPFTDVAEGEYYTEAVAWAYENGIVTGYGDGTFQPDRKVSRQELAAVFIRYLRYKGVVSAQPEDVSGYTDAASIEEWAVEAVGAMTALELLKGDANGAFRPKAGASRGETAAVLVRMEKYLA